jgi:YgiT-type zinc finger domain-containing protein
VKCVVCKKGETKPGKTTVTLEKDGATLVFKGVPADVCANCGEEYVDSKITPRFSSLPRPLLAPGFKSKSVNTPQPTSLANTFFPVSTISFDLLARDYVSRSRHFNASRARTRSRRVCVGPTLHQK